MNAMQMKLGDRIDSAVRDLALYITGEDAEATATKVSGWPDVVKRTILETARAEDGYRDMIEQWLTAEEVRVFVHGLPAPATPPAPDFEAALTRFLAGCQEICDAHDRKLDKRVVLLRPGCPLTRSPGGRRYVRIVNDGSAWCFVDKTNGDVLKPASWKAPAKHARGNIYDDSNGLSWMSAYGPAYLR